MAWERRAGISISCERWAMAATTRIRLSNKLVGNSYNFGKSGEYRVAVAHTLDERKRAWALVYRVYLEKGYATPDADGLWFGLHDALPQTTTFLVTRHGVDVATISIVLDSEFGLPADGLYNDELDKMRADGRRLCEIISLVSEEADRKQCVEVLKHMFKVAWLMSCKLADATDFIITVNPHHAMYYERKLLFRRQGEIRSYGKVGGAPAVLLVLDLESAPDRYINAYGTGCGSLGHHFLDAKTGSEAIWFLAENVRRRADDDLIVWFAQKRPAVFKKLLQYESPFDVTREAHAQTAAACGVSRPSDPVPGWLAR